jgi:hypothetical protein
VAGPSYESERRTPSTSRARRVSQRAAAGSPQSVSARESSHDRMHEKNGSRRISERDKDSIGHVTSRQPYREEAKSIILRRASMANWFVRTS